MRVLMFGWEFPPYHAGGLGPACQGLTKGLSAHGVEVTFVVPRLPGAVTDKFLRVMDAENWAENQDQTIPGLKYMPIEAALLPYVTPESYGELQEKINQARGKEAKGGEIYGRNLFAEVKRFAILAGMIAKQEDFVLIHAHDWMTYPAGIAAKQATGKPLVLHVHATEFERTDGHPNQVIYEIERAGFAAADLIVPVGQWMKAKIVERYGIDPAKIVPLHNAVDITPEDMQQRLEKLSPLDKVVLFVGRVTIQKGPEFFLQAAKRVLEVDPKVTFIMVGSGDMLNYIIEQTAAMDLADKFIFPGFLKGEALKKIFALADVFVMPSVAEPFGLVPLEAMQRGVPAIISKQSGVAEMFENALKVDFWDIDEMANKILGLLEHAPLRKEMVRNGQKELTGISWQKQGAKMAEIYQRVLQSIKNRPRKTKHKN